MKNPWYNDRGELFRRIKKEGLAGLNAVAEARHEACYSRGERLSEFVFLGYFWGDSCGNFGKILWKDERMISPIYFIFPVVATPGEWFALMEIYQVETPGYSLSWELPPGDMVCDLCHKAWTIDDCHRAKVVRTDKDIPLEPYVGKTLAEAEKAVEKTFAATVFLQPDLLVGNPANKELKWHPVYRNVELSNGWVRNVNKNRYVIQPGDVGYFNIWYYRHPVCQSSELERTERIYFADVFQKAGYTNIDLAAIPNEYCGDPTCCPPWFLAATSQGYFIIGWRKRVINLQWDTNGFGESRNLLGLFKGEEVTKGTDNSPDPYFPGATNKTQYIHCWGTEKAIEYLTRIRESLSQS
jgi:hypothetical protein